ncbi:MAG TPA: hypothetical protein VGA69_09260 [Nitriliruptorales bacterium]
MTRDRNRPRTPGLLNVAAVGVVVTLVGTLALGARQQPPPTVAEFAPQAVEQIEEALPEQADPVGHPEGPGPPIQPGDPTPSEQPGDGATPDPTASPTPPVEQARVRRCVGDPPRQTEDPQSPPCVPFFDGDNGGATWKGVTAGEIRIAMARQGFGGASDEEVLALAEHFNRRYELYGRQIVVVFYEPIGGTFALPNPPDMIADAVKVDEELGAFASLAYPDRRGAEHHHYDELARRGIISSIFRGQSRGTTAGYQQQHPHQWNVLPASDRMLAQLGDITCTSLAGVPPQGGTFTATPVSPAPEQRVFGLLSMRTPDGAAPPMDALRQQLGSCGVELAADIEGDEANPDGPNAVLAMQDAGVTTILYAGSPGPLKANYMSAATNQGYLPEWVVSSFLDNDLDNTFHGAPAEQASNVLGVTFRDKLLPRRQMPWYWAIRESRPDLDPSGGVYYPIWARYQQLLQLASGIQLAGPRLTPETFAAGLQAASFPNPDAGAAPYFQAAIDYSGDHTGIDSGALFWYSTTAPGTVDPAFTGAVCYVDQGSRYGLGGYPAAPVAFFQEPCR